MEESLKQKKRNSRSVIQSMNYQTVTEYERVNEYIEERW